MDLRGVGGYSLRFAPSVIGGWRHPHPVRTVDVRHGGLELGFFQVAELVGPDVGEERNGRYGERGMVDLGVSTFNVHLRESPVVELAHPR